MNKRKTIIIILLVLLLLVGGAGGYLLWRVNQQDTVAPTDSDAGLVVKEGGCTGEEISITFYPYKSEEGELKYDSELEIITPNEGEENNLELKLVNSCTEEVTITATPKEGYTFKYWDDVARQRKSTNPSMRVRYQDYADGKVNELKAVYEEGGGQGIESESKTLTVTYEASCGTKGTKDLLSCSDPSSGVIRAETDCLDQQLEVGNIGKPVYITNPKDEECVFQHWEVDGEGIGSEISHMAEFGKDTTVKAIFERRYKGKNFSLKYSSNEGGDLKVDDSIVKEYPVIIQFSDGQPYPRIPVVEAVPKDGWVFEKWESNIVGSPLAADRTKNPRNDTDRKVDLDIVAVYNQEEGKDGIMMSGTQSTQDKRLEPSKPVDPPETIEPPKADHSEKPVVSDKLKTSPGNERVDTIEEKMPQTSAFSDRSLYVITVGALVLCLGMIWQYIPKDIFKRFRK